MSVRDAIVLGMTQAPDPANPSIIPFGCVAGGLVAGTVARIRRLPPDRVSRMTLDGSYLGGVLGALCYVTIHLL